MPENAWQPPSDLQALWLLSDTAISNLCCLQAPSSKSSDSSVGPKVGVDLPASFGEGREQVGIRLLDGLKTFRSLKSSALNPEATSFIPAQYKQAAKEAKNR